MCDFQPLHFLPVLDIGVQHVIQEKLRKCGQIYEQKSSSATQIVCSYLSEMETGY